MPQKIHYRDDIFLLSMIVKTLDACVTVEADAEYYRDRVVADIFFVDSTIRVMSEVLTRNPHLVSRSEYLKLLERVSSDYLRALEKLHSGECPSSGEYAAYEPQIKTLIAGQKAISLELRDLLEERGEESSWDAEVVSDDEIERLLGD
jgi:hypothetical protein